MPSTAEWWPGSATLSTHIAPSAGGVSLRKLLGAALRRYIAWSAHRSRSALQIR
jgi:hypothetical protein